jgi:hypothetical protein
MGSSLLGVLAHPAVFLATILVHLEFFSAHLANAGGDPFLVPLPVIFAEPFQDSHDSLSSRPTE